MSLTYKIIIFIASILFSLPSIAQISSDMINNTESFITKYEDIIKHLITMIGVLFTVLGVIIAAKIARRAPDAAVKLEQLKYIDLLMLNNAWDKKDERYVVEEAFNQYYKKYIPVDIIVLLSNLDRRFYAFSFYMKVSNRVSFNEKTGNIKSLSNTGKDLYFINLFFATIVLLGVSSLVAFTALALFSIESNNNLNFIVGVITTFVSGVVMYLFFIYFNMTIDFYSDMKKFEIEMGDKIEKTEFHYFEYYKLIFLIILMVVIFFAFKGLNSLPINLI